MKLNAEWEGVREGEKDHGEKLIMSRKINPSACKPW